jgi:hypothetical protein
VRLIKHHALKTRSSVLDRNNRPSSLTFCLTSGEELQFARRLGSRLADVKEIKMLLLLEIEMQRFPFPSERPRDLQCPPRLLFNQYRRLFSIKIIWRISVLKNFNYSPIDPHLRRNKLGPKKENEREDLENY